MKCPDLRRMALIDVLILMAIIGIILAVAIPQYKAYFDRNVAQEQRFTTGDVR